MLPFGRLVALALTAAAVAAPDVAAWTPRTRIRMVDEAIRLMPASLRLALERHREDVRRGALEPMVDEDDPSHLPPWDGGSLDASVERAARELIAGVDEARPFAEVARRFGTLSHFVADTGFPPGAAGASGNPHYAHFAAFCESRSERFPLVFYGHEDPALERGEFGRFALEALGRARAEDRQLDRAYRAAGNPPSASAFDDRSVPFAVGSLSYSRTVTDIVRAWLAAWGRAHGDLGRTPYLDPSTRKRLQGGPR